MNRLRLIPAGLLLAWLAACGSQTAAPTPLPLPSPSAAAPGTSIAPVRTANEIRFALVGSLIDANVWAMFDPQGYSYNDYAVRSMYWPRLYQLSIPGRQFTAMAASGTPSVVQAEGNLYTATVPLRTDLSWSDGSPFSAEDVAFTVNSAVAFQLGFDWRAYYDPAWIDHVQALDAHTVKFFFKNPPNVGIWQYGVLLGPIVQKQYWAARIAPALARLPSNDLVTQIDSLRGRSDEMQAQLDQLMATPVPANVMQQTQATINRERDKLNQINSDLNKAQADFQAALDAAHRTLFSTDGSDEPTLGPWMPSEQGDGSWVNVANPQHPFGQPGFDRASYQFFDSENDALSAQAQNKVDMVLTPQGQQQPPPYNADYTVRLNLVSDSRFLAFNLAQPPLNDAALRQAMACLLWMPDRSQGASADGFILRGNDFWWNNSSQTPCSAQGGINPAYQLAWAVQLLKTAGYSWSVEPRWNEAAGLTTAGQVLILPSGQAFPKVDLLSLSQEADPLQAAEAAAIQQQSRLLGIQVNLQYASSEEIRYAVFSSHQFDLAILGWHTGAYPGYLCDWFKSGNPFQYDNSRLKPHCDVLDTTTDLGMAQQQIFQIQSILVQDLPLIPLYSNVTYDAYRNLSYPFGQILDGLSGAYGAPSLAFPTSQ